ncbi:Uncharacterised protein [uncultured archaeon]|nr:Uncharacterised protein [uncultured archaeon]
MKTRKLSVDLDDTLVSLVPAILPEVNSKLGTNVTEKDVRDYYDNALFHSGLDVSALCRKAWSRPEELKLVDPKLPDMLSSLSNEYCYKIQITTGTVADLPCIRSCLDHNGIVGDSIVKVWGQQAKVKQEFSVHVDDLSHVASMMNDAGKDVILLRRPWNTDIVASRGTIKVVDGWPEAYEILRRR